MRSITLSVATLSLLFIAGSSISAKAQEKVTGKVDAKIAAVQTPQIQAANVPAKNWRPRQWLEIDVDMKLKKAVNPASPAAMIETVEVKYFISLNKADATGEFILLTG